MGWKDIEDQQQAEKIPAGTYEGLRIVRVIRNSKKAPTGMTSASGDPQIVLIVADDEAREATMMLTLSSKAAWKLKQVLVAIGADLEAMDRDGVGFINFQDEMFAAAQLMDRPFRGEVRYKNGYAEIVAFARKPYEGEKEESIPI